MTKIYMFKYDSDMTMRSKPENIKAFTTYEAAYKYGKEFYHIKDEYVESYMKNWEIEELELNV